MKDSYSSKEPRLRLEVSLVAQERQEHSAQ